jgi:hypothetical protein
MKDTLSKLHTIWADQDITKRMHTEASAAADAAAAGVPAKAKEHALAALALAGLLRSPVAQAGAWGVLEALDAVISAASEAATTHHDPP